MPQITLTHPELDDVIGAVLYRLVAFKRANPVDQAEVDRHQKLYSKLLDEAHDA